MRCHESAQCPKTSFSVLGFKTFKGRILQKSITFAFHQESERWSIPVPIDAGFTISRVQTIPDSRHFKFSHRPPHTNSLQTATWHCGNDWVTTYQWLIWKPEHSLMNWHQSNKWARTLVNSLNIYIRWHQVTFVHYIIYVETCALLHSTWRVHKSNIYTYMKVI